MFNRILPYTTPAQPTPEELASGRNSFWRAIALWTLAILFIAAVSKSRALSVVGNFSGSAVSIGIALVWLLIFLGSVLS